MFERDRKEFDRPDFRNMFLTHVYNGETLAECCAIMKINPGALGVAMLEMPEFDKQVRDALMFRIDITVDKLERIDEYIDDPVMAGVISKNIQWLAERRSRKLYGAKVEHNVTHNINIRAAMVDATQRTIEHINGNTLAHNNSLTDNISVEQPPIDLTPIEKSTENIDPLS